MLNEQRPADSVSVRPNDASEQLIHAVQQLSAAHSLDDVVGIVKTAARRMTCADGATFVLRDGELCHYVDEDAIGLLWKGRRFPMDICISGWVMRNRQPTLIPDIFADERIPQDAYRPTFVRSLAMVPIRTLSPIGAIGIYWREAHSPSTEAVRWLQSLADSTALAIEYLERRSELHEANYRAELLKSQNVELIRDAKMRNGGQCVRMCFMTNRFEVDGEWLSIEAFLNKRFGVEISHGLSPDALARLESDMLAKCDASQVVSVDAS